MTIHICVYIFNPPVYYHASDITNLCDIISCVILLILRDIISLRDIVIFTGIFARVAHILPKTPKKMGSRKACVILLNRREIILYA